MKKVNNKFEVYSNGRNLGKVEFSENYYHNKCVYLTLVLEDYNKENSEILFQKLSSEMKKPLQIMISSEDLQVISFIKEARFVCKSKCFELEVSRQD